MEFTHFNAVGDTTTTTGTGTLTGIGTAPSGGYQTPTAAGVTSGTYNIVIRVVSGSDWEVCESVYDASADTYTRGTLLASSTGSRVSFAAGTANIYWTLAVDSFGSLEANINGAANYGWAISINKCNYIN